MDDDIKRKRGRPPINDTRKSMHTVRFDDEEEAMIQHIEMEMDINISDIIRKAVRMFYNFKFRML